MDKSELLKKAHMAHLVAERLMHHFFKGDKTEAMAIWATIGLHDQLMLFSYLGHACALDDIKTTGLTGAAAHEVQQYILEHL